AGVSGSREDLLHRQTSRAGASHISGLRTRGDDDVVWVGYDDDAKTRALCHLIDERDWIDGMFVAGDVLVQTRFGESAAHGDEGRCKHDASEVGAPRQERRGGVTAFARPSEMQACVSMTGFDRVERRGDKIDFAWGSASRVLARRAVAAGSGNVQIRHSEIARPPRDSLLQRGRALLDVEVVGLHLPASIRRGDLGGKDNHNLGPGTASGRVIIADALTLLVDGRPHGTRPRGTLGVCYPFAAKKLGARERLRLELGCRCGRTRLRMRCFARKPEHEERAHERPCKWRMGPSALETTGTLTGNSGKRHR